MNWKWKTAQSSVETELNHDHGFDIILSTNMVNLASWAGINRSNIGNAKLVHYFHENQLTYPHRLKHDNVFFGFIDFTSAVSADYVLFNSEFHKNSFIKAIKKLSKDLPEKLPENKITEIEAKSSVIGIGINQNEFNNLSCSDSNDIPLILWNHRWEEDKDPKLFLETLVKIKYRGVKFNLVMLGAAPRKLPDYFKEYQNVLNEEVLHWGKVESRKDYINWLEKSDILPVTSNHDYFGLSVLEAAATNNHLLLPLANAYPDHFKPEEFPQIYYKDSKELESKLLSLIKTKTYETKKSKEVALKYTWDKIIVQYDNFFDSISS